MYRKKPANWRSSKSRYSSFSKKALARELHYLLDIPIQVFKSKGGFRYERPVKGQEIIDVVIKTMVDALRNGESISIKGFGTFRVEEIKPRRTGHNIMASTADGEILGWSSVPIDHPIKKVVVFLPSPHLKAMVNMNPPNVPNKKQREAIESWIQYANRNAD